MSKTNINLIVNGNKVYARSTTRSYTWAVVRYGFRKASSKAACLGLSNLSNDRESAMRVAEDGSRYSNVRSAFQSGFEPTYMVVPVVDGIVNITTEDAARLMMGTI